MNVYPRFFEVDDIYVVLEIKKGWVVAHTHGGRPYPIGKALVDGVEINRAEYFTRAKKWGVIYLPN